jgi:hypothetical protein
MTAENMKRPAYIVRTSDGASDLTGSMVGAFVSTALAWQKYGNDSAYVDKLMKEAVTLYKEAKKYEGSYTAKFKCVSAPVFCHSEVCWRGRRHEGCGMQAESAGCAHLIFYSRRVSTSGGCASFKWSDLFDAKKNG